MAKRCRMERIGVWLCRNADGTVGLWTGDHVRLANGVWTGGFIQQADGTWRGHFGGHWLGRHVGLRFMRPESFRAYFGPTALPEPGQKCGLVVEWPLFYRSELFDD